MKKRVLILLITITCATSLFAQAGKDTYQFLNLPTSARAAALGGMNISLLDNDLNLAFNNPALLTENSNNMLSINYVNYLSDINLGSVAYGRSFGKNNHMMFGIHYIDYGTFLGTSETDEITGNFTAKDFALNIMYTRTLPLGFAVGATLKPIYSVYERYSSFGVAFDFGASYHNDSLGFSSGLTLRNAGWQFTGYYSIDGAQHRETLPFDLELGVSQKFKHAPIRFSLTLHNLQQWDLNYQKSTSVTTEDNSSNEVKWNDMMFRHTVWAVEILPSKNMYLTVSYNHRRRKEMNVDDWKTAAGFAFGAGFNIYKFNVGFALVPYQVGNVSYHFTLSTGLSDFGIK